MGIADDAEVPGGARLPKTRSITQDLPAEAPWGPTEQFLTSASFGAAPYVEAGTEALHQKLQQSGYGPWTDWIFGGASAPATDYETALARQRQGQANWQQAHPYQNIAANVAGSAIPMTGVTGGVTRLLSPGARLLTRVLLPPVVGGAVTQGITSGVEQPGDLKQRMMAAGEGALEGGAGGFVGGTLGWAGAQALKPFTGAGVTAALDELNKASPSPEGMRATIRLQNTLLENDPTTYPSAALAQKVNALAQGFGRKLDEGGSTPDAYKAMTRLRSLTSTGSPVSLHDIEIERQFLNKSLNQGGNIDTDKYLTGQIKKALDDFVTSAGPNDVLSGNAATAAQIYQDVHGNEAANYGASDLRDVMTTAEGKKNPEAYLRTQFQKRVTDDQVAIDKGHQPQYSGPVREAMANVNQPSAGEQALNFAGRYAPETGTGFIPWITGPIGPAEAIGRSLGQEGVGAAMGATGGTLVGGAALVAKRLAASILRDKAAMAEALVRAQSPMGRSMGAPQTIPSVPVVPGPATQGVATAGATQAVPPAWQYVTSNYPGNAFGALPSNGSP